MYAHSTFTIRPVRNRNRIEDSWGRWGQVGKDSCSTQVRATTVNAVVHDVTAPMEMVR